MKKLLLSTLLLIALSHRSSSQSEYNGFLRHFSIVVNMGASTSFHYLKGYQPRSCFSCVSTSQRPVSSILWGFGMAYAVNNKHGYELQMGKSEYGFHDFQKNVASQTKWEMSREVQYFGLELMHYNYLLPTKQMSFILKYGFRMERRLRYDMTELLRGLSPVATIRFGTAIRLADRFHIHFTGLFKSSLNPFNKFTADIDYYPYALGAEVGAYYQIKE